MHTCYAVFHKYAKRGMSGADMEEGSVPFIAVARNTEHAQESYSA